MSQFVPFHPRKGLEQPLSPHTSQWKRSTSHQRATKWSLHSLCCPLRSHGCPWDRIRWEVGLTWLRIVLFKNSLSFFACLDNLGISRLWFFNHEERLRAWNHIILSSPWEGYHPISDGMATRQVNFLSRKHLKVGNPLKNIPHETTMNHFWIQYPETFLDPFWISGSPTDGFILW
jgi:hypothetical protein